MHHPPGAAEVLATAYYAADPQELAEARALVDSLTFLPLDREAHHEAGRMWSDLKKRGVTLGASDLFSAAISRRHGQTLLTRDRAFGQVPGLAVELYYRSRARSLCDGRGRSVPGVGPSPQPWVIGSARGPTRFRAPQAVRASPPSGERPERKGGPLASAPCLRPSASFAYHR